MVQYQRFDKNEALHDDYWKLRSNGTFSRSELHLRLGERGFVYSPNAPNKRLRELLSRVERGLLCYDGCHTSELLRFCRDRGLKQTSNAKATVIQTLEEADEAFTFSRFMDLPSELRVRVYTVFFRGLNLPTCPRPPPI